MRKGCWSIFLVGLGACSSPSPDAPDASAADATVDSDGPIDAPIDATPIDATPRGLLDTTFGDGGYVMLGDDVVLSSVAVAADGSIFGCGGEHDNFDTLRIVKVTASGQPDAGFGSGGVVAINTGVAGCAFVQPLADGRIAFATSQPRVRFLAPNGTYDSATDLVPASLGTPNQFVGIEPAWDGGYFLYGEGNGQSLVWRYDSSDRLMPSFGGDGVSGEMNYIGGRLTHLRLIEMPAGRRLSIGAYDAVRLDAVSGLRDPSFGAQGHVSLDNVLLPLPGPDGAFAAIGQQGETSRVRRVSPTGVLEPWQDAPVSPAQHIGHWPAGKLTWMFYSAADEDVRITRLDLATTLHDSSFGIAGTSSISLSIPGETPGQGWPGFRATYVVPAPGGKLIVAGEYSRSIPNGGGEEHDVMFVRLDD